MKKIRPVFDLRLRPDGKDPLRTNPCAHRNFEIIERLRRLTHLAARALAEIGRLGDDAERGGVSAGLRRACES